jgi:phage terminase large subunit-like protein
VLARANEQKPNAILIEDTGFGTALIGALKQRGLHVVAVKPEGDKKVVSCGKWQNLLMGR